MSEWVDACALGAGLGFARLGGSFRFI